MMTAGVTGVPIEALVTLRRRLAALPGRHPQREALLSSTYVDCIVFSVFQWARIGSPRDVLPQEDGYTALRAWRARMISLHGGLGDRFAGYPAERRGPDGKGATGSS